MGQNVSERMSDRLPGRSAAGEVSLPAGITPAALRVPMPGFDVQLRVLPIAEGLPSRREDLLHHRLGKELVGRSGRDAVNAGSQRGGRNEGFGSMAGRPVYADSLR